MQDPSLTFLTYSLPKFRLKQSSQLFAMMDILKPTIARYPTLHCYYICKILFGRFEGGIV